MKLSVVGDIPEGKEGGRLRIIDTFVQDHKGGGGVVMCAGSLRLLHITDKYAKDKGYPSIIFGNNTELAILNADKVLLLWTKAYDLDDLVLLCKKYKKPHMEIR